MSMMYFSHNGKFNWTTLGVFLLSVPVAIEIWTQRRERRFQSIGLRVINKKLDHIQKMLETRPRVIRVFLGYLGQNP